MLAINLDEFNFYILENRFIWGDEVAWFKCSWLPITKIGVIIQCEAEFEAITYKRIHGGSFWLDKFKKFAMEGQAHHFLQDELEQ